MSSSVKVVASIGSPKSTVMVAESALVRKAVVLERIGAGPVLSKVTDNVGRQGGAEGRPVEGYG
jgi:hypothetical protein